MHIIQVRPLKVGRREKKNPYLRSGIFFFSPFFPSFFLDFSFRKILSRTVLAKWVWWDWECARIPWGIGIAGGLYLTSEALCFDLNAGLSFKLPQRSRSCDQAVGWCYLSARLWVLRDAQILAIPMVVNGSILTSLVPSTFSSSSIASSSSLLLVGADASEADRHSRWCEYYIR